MADPQLLIAYYRVSTKKQGASGLGLEAQRETCLAFAKSRGSKVAGEITEVESGRNKRRPQLASALSLAKSTGAKLIVAKLDRLARDTSFLLALIDGGVPVIFCDLPELATGDPVVGRLILTIMAAIAEFESRRIGQRIREAYAAAKKRGRPIKTGMRSAATRRAAKIARSSRIEEADEFRGMIMRDVRPLRRKGYSLATIAAILNDRGTLSRHGKKWTVANLHRLISS